MTHLEHPARPEDNELPPPDRSVEEYLAELEQDNDSDESEVS